MKSTQLENWKQQFGLYPDGDSLLRSPQDQRPRRKAAVVGEMKRRQVDQCFAELDGYGEH